MFEKECLFSAAGRLQKSKTNEYEKNIQKVTKKGSAHKRRREKKDPMK